MKTLTILTFFISGILAVQAQEVDTLYYKDAWRRKETSEKKAKYYYVRNVTSDGIIKSSLYNSSSNNLVYHSEYKGDMPYGLWTENRYEGRSKSYDYRFDLNYSDQKIEDGIYPEQDPGSNLIEATYEGGKTAFYKYVGKTIRYPAFARRNGIEGSVFVHFKINREGKVEIISIFKGVEKHLDQEAARVFFQSPKWTPAKKNGQAIDSYYIIPLAFKLA